MEPELCDLPTEAEWEAEHHYALVVWTIRPKLLISRTLNF